MFRTFSTEVRPSYLSGSPTPPFLRTNSACQLRNQLLLWACPDADAVDGADAVVVAVVVVWISSN